MERNSNKMNRKETAKKGFGLWSELSQSRGKMFLVSKHEISFTMPLLSEINHSLYIRCTMSTFFFLHFAALNTSTLQ